MMTEQEWTRADLTAVGDRARDMRHFDLTTEEAAAFLLSKTTGWVDDEHGHDTPKRFAAMLTELTTPADDWNFTTFPADGMDEMITIGPIPFVSVCNHHVIPFVGHVWIGYIPDKLMAGLSKFARLSQQLAKKLQVQERYTVEVADALAEFLEPKGVAVVVKAEHFCMTVRGVQTPGVQTTTSAMRGVFADHDRTAKAEFLDSIR
jgi:GTP cyclohydrolase I